MMLSPEIPENEDDRLEYLRNLNILDTPEEEIYDKVTRLACEIMDMPMSALSFIDADRVFFKSKVGVNATEVPRDISICGHTINNSEPLIIDDASKDKRFSESPLVTSGPNIKSYAGFPITLDNNLAIGSFCVFSNQPRKLSNEDLSALEMLRDLIKRIMSEKHDASTDPLTGCFNRRMFKTIGEKIFSGIARKHENFKQEYLSLIILDIDHFKSVNDNFGHDGGDAVLTQISDVIKSTLRKQDYVFRMGGEEFVIFLTEAEINAAMSFSERLRQKIEDHDFNHKDNTIKITTSFGVAQHGEFDHDINELLARADHALYEAKKQGRNKVVEASD